MQASNDERTKTTVDFLEDLIPEAQYAARRGVSVRTCQRDRQLRQGPPFILLGRQVFYRVEAVREWLLEQERGHPQPTPRRRR